MRNNIRTMRLLSDLSLDEVAQRLAVDPYTLREWENDASLLPTLSNIHKERLSRLFRMSDDEIHALLLPQEDLILRLSISETTPLATPSRRRKPPAHHSSGPATRHHMPSNIPQPIPSPATPQHTYTLPSGGQFTLETATPLLALSPLERHLLGRIMSILDDLCEISAR